MEMIWARSGLSFTALLLALFASSSVFAYWRSQLGEDANLSMCLVMFTVCGLILIGVNLFSQVCGERACWSVKLANGTYLALAGLGLAVNLMH